METWKGLFGLFFRKIHQLHKNFFTIHFSLCRNIIREVTLRIANDRRGQRMDEQVRELISKPQVLKNLIRSFPAH